MSYSKLSYSEMPSLNLASSRLTSSKLIPSKLTLAKITPLDSTLSESTPLVLTSLEPTSLESTTKYWLKINDDRGPFNSGNYMYHKCELFDKTDMFDEKNINDEHNNSDKGLLERFVKRFLDYMSTVFTTTVSTTNNINKLFLKNVSADFIKGIYMGLYDPLQNKALDNKILIQSDFQFDDCMSSNIIVSWDDYDGINDTIENNMNNGIYFDNLTLINKPTLRSKILRNPKKCNAWLQNYMKNINEFITKRFIGFVQVRDTDYIIQFDSIDFLNGFETIRLWKSGFDRWIDDEQLYLSLIFDELKICKKSVIYQTPQKEKNKLTLIFNIVSKYLPKTLAQLVINIVGQQCNYDDENNNYDSCKTITINSMCNVHQKVLNRQSSRLENCLATIDLEQL